jgi:hypothetical protein
MFFSKKISALLVLIICSCFGLMLAQDGPAMEKQSAGVVKKVFKAATATGEAYSHIYAALGKKEEAAKMDVLSKSLKSRKAIRIKML